MNMNHSTHPSVADSPPRLRDELADLARRLMHSVADRTSSETQLLKDIQRIDGRCTFARLERLAEIASRSPDPADREALPTVLRKRTRRREHAAQLTAASIVGLEDEEYCIEAEENLAQRERQKHPESLSAKSRLAAALRRRISVTERFLEAL